MRDRQLKWAERALLPMALATGLTLAPGFAQAQETDKPLSPDCAGTPTERVASEPPVYEFDLDFDYTNPELGLVPPALDLDAEIKAAGEICNTPEARVDPDEEYEKTDDSERPAANCATPPYQKIVAGIRDHYAMPQEKANLTPGIRAATGVAGPWTDFDQQDANYHFGHAFQPVFSGHYLYGRLMVRLRPIDDIPKNDTLSLWSTGRPGWGTTLTNITPMRPGREVSLHFDLRTLGSNGTNLLNDLNVAHDLNIYVQDDSSIDQMELELSCSNPEEQRVVGVISSNGTCGDGKVYEIFLDNEDKRNTNGRGGWIGATVSNKNTLFKVCAVPADPFVQAAEAGANFAVLALSGTCPTGFTRFDRFHDNEDNRPASYDTLPSGSPTRTVQPEQNTNMAFCVATGSNTGAPNSAFPDLGFEYGVFGARTPATWALNRGWVHLDDEDNRNKNAPANPPAYTWQFLQGGGNTTYYLAKVR